MSTVRTLLFLIIIVVLLMPAHQGCSSDTKVADEILMLIRCDDIGMNHTVNMAADSLINHGIKFSASVMFVCPWYQEAVEILKGNPQIAVGVHLTLNSEWKHYRWGPVLGADAVPSLVDSNGYFFPSIKKLFANNPTNEDIERELTAQLERALSSGLKIDYVDYHMGTAVAKPEWREIVESLARKHHLGIAIYFDERGYAGLYSVPVESKTDSLVKLVSKLEPGHINLLVSHIGLDNPEMAALIDQNDEFPLEKMSNHRFSEFKALMSEEFSQILKDRKIRLITYRDVIAMKGLAAMKRPTVDGY